MPHSLHLCPTPPPHAKVRHCPRSSRSSACRLSSSVCRCFPKVSSTPPITLAFTSCLCLSCSSLEWSSCERILWLQSCGSQGNKISLAAHMGPDSRALLVSSGPSSSSKPGSEGFQNPKDACLLTFRNDQVISLLDNENFSWGPITPTTAMAEDGWVLTL